MRRQFFAEYPVSSRSSRFARAELSRRDRCGRPGVPTDSRWRRGDIGAPQDARRRTRFIHCQHYYGAGMMNDVAMSADASRFLDFVGSHPKAGPRYTVRGEISLPWRGQLAEISRLFLGARMLGHDNNIKHGFPLSAFCYSAGHVCEAVEQPVITIVGAGNLAGALTVHCAEPDIGSTRSFRGGRQLLCGGRGGWRAKLGRRRCDGPGADSDRDCLVLRS